MRHVVFGQKWSNPGLAREMAERGVTFFHFINQIYKMSHLWPSHLWPSIYKIYNYKIIIIKFIIINWPPFQKFWLVGGNLSRERDAWLFLNWRARYAVFDFSKNFEIFKNSILKFSLGKFQNWIFRKISKNFEWNLIDFLLVAILSIWQNYPKLRLVSLSGKIGWKNSHFMRIFLLFLRTPHDFTVVFPSTV